MEVITRGQERERKHKSIHERRRDRASKSMRDQARVRESKRELDV